MTKYISSSGDHVIDVQAATKAERAALAGDLATVTEDALAQPSLSVMWNVEEVVAHLTAAASLGRLRWISSVILARFDFDRHNARRLAEHRGSSPASKDAVKGVHLRAVDGPFDTGTGSLVEGTTLALVMAMAGRVTCHPDLTGPGVASMGATGTA